MTNQEKLPQENKSQEIGHHAVLSFGSKHPPNWRVTPTDGDSDAGLDYQVQVVDEGNYKFVFHVQIKGSRELHKTRGNCKYLSKGKDYYSVKLKIPTLNYYARIENPKLMLYR